MKKVSLMIMIVSGLSKVLGFFREVVLSNAYGAGVVSDAFIYIYNFPSLIFSVVVAAFVTGFIPMFTRIEKQEGENAANLFLNNIQNVMIVISLGLSLIVFLFTEPILVFLLRNASSELMTMLIPFTKIAVITILLTSVIQILTGYLQIKESFLFIALLAFPLNIILIGTILLSKKYGVVVLPVGIVIAYLFQAVAIYLYSRKKGYKFKFHLNMRDKNLILMLSLAIPLIVGSASSSIASLVNQGLASAFNGGISYISYATRIGGLIEGVFGVAIVTVMYPMISRMISENKEEEASYEYSQSMSSLLLVIVPSAFGMIVFARPIVEFIYMRGQFGVDDVNTLVPIFITYSFGLVSYSMYGLISRIFYSFQDTRTPMIVSIFNISIQVILGIVFSKIIGLPGISLAMAISATVGVTILFAKSLELFVTFNLKEFIIEAVKILTSSIIMATVSYLLYLFASAKIPQSVSLFISIAIACFLYLALVVLFKVKSITELLAVMKRKKA